MYKRGNWSVTGLDPTSLSKFKDFLNEPSSLLDISAVLGLVTCKMREMSAVGINPFAAPRLDENIFAKDTQAAFPIDLPQMLSAYAQAVPEDRAITNTSCFLAFYGNNASVYTIDESRQWYGFWYVMNVWKDSNDVNSLKEKLSYEAHDRPYPFLTGDDKKHIDAEASTATCILRRQFPVLIDYAEGLVFAETTANPEIESLIDTLGTMGLEIEPRAWSFGVETDWVTQFLDYIEKNTKHRDEFAKRAEELTRFRKDQVEKLQDKTLERIVSNYFALTELPNGLWGALKSPAQIKLQPTSDAPLAASTPSNAFTLCSFSDEASVVASNVVFQELHVRTKPNNSEYCFRNDLFTMIVDPGINNLDYGVAYMRGFDLPSLKREINREIRKTKVAPDIAHYWKRWMEGMRDSIATFIDCLKTTLEIDGKTTVGLIKPSMDDDDDGVTTVTMGVDLSSKGMTTLAIVDDRLYEGNLTPQDADLVINVKGDENDASS